MPLRAHSEALDFNIVAGDAIEKLKVAAYQADVELLFAMGIPAGIQTNLVIGRFSISEALDRMLEGTPLKAIPVNGGEAFGIMNRAKKGGNELKRSQDQLTQEKETNIEPMEPVKNEKKSVINNLFKGILSLATVSATVDLTAQNSEAENEVFELSPFSVDASGDQGYYASETLSGTQLRTDLRSLANPVTVLTEEMMRDIGAVNYEEAVEYLPSTVSFTGDTSDNDGNTARTGTPYTSRGFRVTALTQDFLSTGIRQDTFNTERLTQSRGPNSLLFGLGSVGGAINTGSKRGRLNRDSQEGDLRLDEHGSTRYEYDINKILVEDKLALRVALLYDDKRTHRDLQYRRRKSAYSNLTYRPFEQTTIHLNGEWGRIDDLNPRLFLIKDRYTAWTSDPRAPIDKANMTDLDLILAGGAPLNEAVNNEVGVSDRFDTRHNFVYILNDPNLPVMNWAYKSRGAEPLVNGQTPNNVSIVEPQLTPDIFMPIDSIPSGLQDRYDTDYVKYSATVEQQLFENTFLQLVYAYEDEDNDDYRPVKRQQWILNVDNNWYLPNQRAVDNPDPSQPMNPYFGLPYLESSSFAQQETGSIEQKRITLSHKQEFGDVSWLGNITGVGTYYENSSGRILLRQDEMAGVPINSNGSFDGNFGRNNLDRRYYFTGDNQPYWPDIPPSPVVQQFDPAFGNHRGEAFLNTPGSYIVPEVNSFLANRLSPINDYTDTASTYFLGQWRLFNDKVMLTAGEREDKITSDSAVYTRDPAFSNRYYTDLNAFTFNGESDASTTNTNYGIVVKPHHMFDFYYNESTNTVSAGSTQYTIFNETVPDQAGDGWDTGIRTFLMEDQLVLKLNYFENNLVNKISNPLRDGAAVGIGLARETGRVERYLRGLEANAATVPEFSQILDGAIYWEEYSGNRLWTDVENTTTTGWELEGIFNATANWRMLLNVTKNDTAVNETFVTFKNWYDQFVTPVKGNAAWEGLVARVGEQNDETLGMLITDIDRKRQFHEAQVGGQQVRSATWKANFVTSYRFDNDSVLKGYRVGATARWREAPVIGYAEVDGDFRVDLPLVGEESFISDWFITKAWKGKGDDLWEASLRVRNIFNDDGWYPSTAIDDGTGNAQFLQQIHLAPRTFEFSLNWRR